MLVAASRQRVLRRRLVASLATVSLLGGCTSSLKFPDLGTLYDQAAQHRDENRNPIVMIPGIMGSKLVDAPTQLADPLYLGSESRRGHLRVNPFCLLTPSVNS